MSAETPPRESRRRKHLAVEENQHIDPSPQHKAPAKEKHGPWMVSRGGMGCYLVRPSTLRDVELNLRPGDQFS